MFNIEMLPAGHGDSLLLEYGDTAAPHRVLIDAGPYYAYRKFAKRIDKLASSGQTVELFVITHIDTDHIDGAIKLLGAPPSGIRFSDIWFNGWKHLVPGRMKAKGAVQGEMLTVLIENKVPWNKAFGGEAVSVNKDLPLPVKPLAGGLTLTLLSPGPQELRNLDPNWETELRDAGLESRSREKVLKALRDSLRYRPPKEGPLDVSALAAQPFEKEKSKSNASSIAFLAEYGGKTCLFAADAQPDRLVASIRSLLQQRGEQRLKVDAVKVSHHGSRGNTSPELLNLLDCKHFLISTNGKMIRPPHPHAEAISRIIHDCGPGVELWFNFRSDQTRLWDNPYLMEQFEFKPHFPAEGQEGLVVPVSEL